MLRPRMLLWLFAAGVVFQGVTAFGEIPKPDDAPQPVDPEVAATRFVLPEGLRMELIASEPLIHEPSGVCWDERGRLFVCELHGFNLDGQIDIDEQNKTGELDKTVRRFFVPEHIEEAAKAGTYGTVKQLIDTDGDGRMDQAHVWADHLPACFGVCPARGGIIVVCAPDIVFLADRDDDGVADVREVLYTGFPTGVLDRRMGTPQWGLDDWIYVGRAHGAATITGPHLSEAVELPNTNFRIKPDGSAIEPVTGDVSGLGFTLTRDGDCFVSSVGWPAHFVAPLPWHALARNPHVSTPPLTVQVFPDRRVYPTSKPHPWRSKRAEDPGFAKFYTDGYGIAESAPNGYFTSCCGPLVYQDDIVPGLQGQLLACEPAQNLIHRSLIQRDGLRLTLRRAEGEEESEFLTTADSWFHPIALSHGPDGAIWISDFYREIIEDYSAIPRYLQQQYGVTNGKDRGRIWRLVPDDAPPYASSDLSELDTTQLASEVGSRLFWRRETARRLLVERQSREAAGTLIALATTADDPAVVINVQQTLDGLGELPTDLLRTLMKHADSGVRRQSLRLAESRFDEEPALLDAALPLADDPEPIVRLQLAMSVGASRDHRVSSVLVRLARQDGDDPWMAAGVLSALGDRGGEMLAELLQSPDAMSQARGLLEPLCFSLVFRRDEAEFGKSLRQISAAQDREQQVACLRGVRAALESSGPVPLDDEARRTIKLLAGSTNDEVRSHGQAFVRLLKLETPAEREARLAQLKERMTDVTRNAEDRLLAIDELATDDDPMIADALVAGLPTATPVLHEALLRAIFSRRDRIPALLDGLENGTVPPTALSAVQRSQLLEDQEESIRNRAAGVLTAASDAALELFPAYAAALDQPRDVAHGLQVFRETCGKCHQAHGIGFAVGPDLSSEFQRAEETMIRDVLAPGETISPGYLTYTVVTNSGQVYTGLLASESPTGVTLKQPEGKLQTILRSEIDVLRVSAVSMMPEDLSKTVKPQDLADMIAWLRQPQEQMVLLDDNHLLASVLTEGVGTAEFISSDKFAGESSLRVTPLQRSAARISGWEFRIREHPAAGEYRYIRFAWKAPQASGVMIELSDDGQWPPADQPLRRYFAGRNLTEWQAVGLSPVRPSDWTVMTRDLWSDFGDFTLTGFAPTAIGGPALFDRMELLRSLKATEQDD